MTYQQNTGMKVFSQLYVSYQDCSKDEVPLGFATPYENNAAGRKRQETADKWASGWERKTPKKAASIINNEPAEGFTITDDIKRVYYGGGNVVFRVEDPRGFELEIQSQNLMALIKHAGLEAGGKIPGKCLWGRDGGSNILIHETSEEYKTARLAAETIKPLKGTEKDYKPGDTVILTNGEQVKYLGRFYFTGFASAYYEKDDEELGHEKGNHVQVDPIHYHSKHFLNCAQGYREEQKIVLDKLPSTQDPVKIVDQQRYFAALGEHGVALYRDLKVTSICVRAAEELSVKDAFDTIYSNRVYTASSGVSPTFVHVSETKDSMVWGTVPFMTDDLSRCLKQMTRNDNYGIYIADEHRGMAGENYTRYLVKDDHDNFFMADYGNSVKNAEDQVGEGFAHMDLVRVDGKMLTRFYVDDEIIRTRYQYRNVNTTEPLLGEQIELFVYDNTLNPMELFIQWFKEGRLFKILPVKEVK